MKLWRRGAADGPHTWMRAAPAVLVAVGLLACAPGEEVPEEEGAAEEASMEAGEAAAAAGAEAMASGGMQGAAACRWTASGQELTGRASPPDSSTVQLGGQTAKLCYSAPSMRDREIMGGLVPYGEPWRMGANEPTTLHLPVAAQVGGVRVEPGSYAVYAIPGETEWTIVLNSDPERWGIPINEEVRAADVGSFTVQPESLEQPVERMSIELESAQDGARVVLEWENTRVSFPVRPATG